MSDNDEDQGAFPINNSFMSEKGLTKREYAAIELRVPNSGAAWLDDMISQRQRDEIAAEVLPQVYASTVQQFSKSNGDANEFKKALAEAAYAIADAMLAAREAE
jgi:hypothetical protein